ncbi:TonB-dependent receptor [Aquabacterium sp.]|uniref:TonB-dependent receptor domain-containing protein n=1 Tax=Aquabacterium sp. TaxID=1872578 RepID=UPI0025BDA4DA|nr:TonB-dependent receptor [Aquabacterium sp.]
MLFLNSVRVAPGVRSALAVALVSVCGTPSMAAESGEEGLPPVVVTATRTPTRINQLSADVSVIDRAQIDAATGRSLASLLSDAPGVQIATNGGLGKTSSIFVRGGDSKQTVLLIDGVRYGSATTGGPSLDNIPLDLIDHIEIVRGPLASLYGADAASGVIQVFTRKGTATLTPSASVTLGSERFHSESVGLTGSHGGWSYGIQANDTGTAGFSSTNSRAGASTFNPDRDGFVQQSLSLNLGLALIDSWRLDGNVLRSSGVSWFDDGVAATGSTPNTNSDMTSSVSGLTLSGKPMANWKTSFKAALTEDVSDVTVANKSYYISRIATQQKTLAWENQISTEVGQVLVAFEHLRQSVDNSTTIFDVKQRTIESLVLGLNGNSAQTDWQLSTRGDRNSQYGTEWTGNLGGGLHWGEALRLGGSVGTSYVAPSFNQLYWPNYGSPDLKPQHGLNREVNLSWDNGSESAKLTRYDNRIHDFLLTGLTAASNVDGVRLAGWTLTGGVNEALSFGRWFASGSLDWLDAHNMADGKKLVRRASRFASARSGLELGSWSYELNVKTSSGLPDTYSYPALDVRLPGYAIWGAAVNWAVAPNWKLALRADNLGNRAYENVYGFNQPGNQYFLTLSYSPK